VFVWVVEGRGSAVCEAGWEVLIAREEEVVAAVGYGEEGKEGMDAQQPCEECQWMLSTE
jgi:hypothetical protein